MDLGLCQTVEVLFLLDDHHLLCREVLEGEHQSPVEVALSVPGPVVDISLLGFILSANPARGRRKSLLCMRGLISRFTGRSIVD